MDNGVTYPSLRCILQYLEANKRIHITSRSISLQRFEKSIPLRLNSLKLGDDHLVINQHLHYLSEYREEVNQSNVRFRPSEERLLPGDIRIGPNTTSFMEMVIKRNNDATHRARIPYGIEKRMAMKTIMRCFLGDRPEIYAANLEFFLMGGGGILRFPESITFKTKKLKTGVSDFRDILQVLHLSSFPLRELETSVKGDDALGHSVLKSAEHLTISYWRADRPWDMPSFQELSNKHITFHHERNFVNEDELIRIIERYIQKPREIGCSLTLGCLRLEFYYEFLKAVRRRLNAKDVQVRRETTKTFCSIPIDSTASAMLIGGVYHNDNKDIVNLKLEVVPLSIISPIPSTEPINHVEAETPPEPNKYSTYAMLGMFGFIVIFTVFVIFASCIFQFLHWLWGKGQWILRRN